MKTSEILYRQLNRLFHVCAGLLCLVPAAVYVIGLQICHGDTLPVPNKPAVVQPAAQRVLSGPISADIGMVDALAQPTATHTFTLTNSTNASIDIASIRGTCGCEHFSLLAAGKEVQSAKLAPGKSVSIKFDVDLKGQPPDELTKSAFVVGDSNNILNTLTLSFRLRQPYIIQPMHLDVGNVSTVAAKRVPATVEIDSALLPDGVFPGFVSDTPGISAKLSGPVRKSLRDGKSVFCQDYLVTVNQPNKIGSFASMLSLNIPTKGKEVDIVYLPISGTIVGDFVASPKTVSFGAIIAGSEVKRSLVLTGSSTDKLDAIKCVSSSQWVTAQIVPNGAGIGKSQNCTLTVTLSGKAPAGLLKTSIILTAGPSEFLTVPVTANVVGT
jgi:hypothetical protein